MTTNPARNNHKIINIIANILSCGDRESIPATSGGFGVSVGETGTGVAVSEGVLVAGNIKVNAGKGASVVDGVGTGV